MGNPIPADMMGSILLATLISGWVIGGRALALSFYYTGDLGQHHARLKLATGLLITPMLLAVASLVSPTLNTVVWVLVAADCLILVLAFVSRRKAGPHTRLAVPESVPAVVTGAVYFLLCLVLAAINGPYVEHLSDAWWHMRQASLLATDHMLVRSTFDAETSSGTFTRLAILGGLDSSSYRLQALTSAVFGLPMLVSWYGSTIVVAGLMGLSFYFLAIAVLDHWLARAVALVVWLIALGGMHTGLRLAGWPAGMGYVFMNLSLLALFQLWSGTDHRKSALLLLGVTILGTLFFHFAELYLICIAAGILIVSALALRAKTAHGLNRLICFLFLLVFATWGFGALRGTPPTFAAIAPVSILVGCLYVCGLSFWTSSRKIALGLTVGCSLVCSALLVDWKHLFDLFDFTVERGRSYYDGYIPDYLIGLGNKLVAIPKWEHQLRASLLWTGVIAVLLSVILFLGNRDRRTVWLLVLSVIPALILVSPPLFSMAVAVIPPYGGYRVQFLIPVALVIGLAVQWCIQLAKTRSQSSRPRAILVCALVLILTAGAVAPDALVRFGFLRDRPWAVHTNIHYHWRLTNNLTTLAVHTSARYLNDIAHIATRTHNTVGAFLSDIATSYYVSAETALVPLVQHPHHSRAGLRYQNAYRAFCSGELSPARLEDLINNRNLNLDASSPARLRYIIVNRDTRNYTAEANGRACVGEIDHLLPTLSTIAEETYHGEFLSLWKLR